MFITKIKKAYSFSKQKFHNMTARYIHVFLRQYERQNLNKEMIPMNGITSSWLVPTLKIVSRLLPPIIKNPKNMVSPLQIL